MKALNFISWSAVALNFAATAFFCERKDADKQLLSMAIFGVCLLLLLINLIAGLRFFPRDKFRAFVPTAICLVGLPLSLYAGGWLGNTIADWRFQKNLARYNEVVRLISQGEFKAGSAGSRIQLPDKYADLALITMAETNSDAIFVCFITGVGFPLKHSGYLYVSTGNLDGNSGLLQRLPYRSRINTNWFEVSD